LKALRSLLTLLISISLAYAIILTAIKQGHLGAEIPPQPAAFNSAHLVKALDAKLLAAATRGDPDTVRRCLADGADINARDYVGGTPLRYALINNHTDLSLLLIDRGADLRNHDDFGQTPLMSAAGKCPGKVIRLLIDKGGNIDARDMWGQNALMHAVAGDNADAVRVLLAAGSNVNFVDKLGRTALLTAKQSGYKDMLRLLRSHRAVSIAPDHPSTAY